MKKFQFFSIIFATAFVATTTLVVSSCSQDDDYYETEMYTLAGKRMTRSAEPGNQEDEMLYHKTFSTEIDFSQESSQVTFNVTYDPKGQQNSIVYAGHDNSALFNVRVQCRQVARHKIAGTVYIYCAATLQANMLILHDTLPPETLLLSGVMERRIPLSQFSF